MTERWRETSCYIIIDSSQETLEMPQAHMTITELDKDEKEITRQKTVAEAYPKARKSLDKKQLVIPVEVGPDETFEEVYTALKAKFGKPVMAHRETIKALDNDKWRETEFIDKEVVTK
ncbi:MAG: hypothetical protein DRP47_11950 [Candidatus Zixiibacteriota bacterium]|nr:MAG: hypothetical protein DRP47_11950 [candidate division Zixibacteria bacterium]